MPGRTDAIPSLPPTRHTILSIQYLRAAAALAVTWSHIGGHAGLNARTGAAGVDVFFVISGFIIWTVTAQRAQSPGRFMLDRLTRVAPPYMLLTAAIYLAAITVPASFPNMRVTLAHALLSAAFIPHTDPYGARFPLVIPGWTLNYEIFFYLVFAAAMTVPRRLRLGAAIALLGGLVLAGLVAPAAGPALGLARNPLLLEFAAGLWLGRARQRGALPGARWGWAALAAGLASLAAWQVCAHAPPDAWRALAWGGPAVLITLGAVTIEHHGRLPRLRAALLLGDASFSLYLVNVFATAAIWRLLGGLPLPVTCTAALAACVLAAAAFRRVVEIPATALARRLAHRRSPARTPRLAMQFHA
jgi:exopolysaccharide production protein ExoZ